MPRQGLLRASQRSTSLTVGAQAAKLHAMLCIVSIVSISTFLYLTAEIFIPPLSVTSGCTEHPTLRRATPLPSKQHHPKKAQSKTKTENYLHWTVFPGVNPAISSPSGGLLFQKPRVTHSAVTNQQTCSHVDEPASLPNFHPLLLHRALRSSARHCCWVACAPSCVCLQPPGRRQPPEPPSVQLS